MSNIGSTPLDDTGERMIPTATGEVSYVFARHKFTYEYARQYAISKRVLDLGCGTGYGCKILSEVAQSVVGIDYSAEAIAYCRKNFSAANIVFEQSDIIDIQSKREFDVAVSFQVIEHMPDLNLFLDKITKAVKHGGTILITTPNVREQIPESDANPFHCNEMNYHQFHALLAKHFSHFELMGVGYASRSRLRTFLHRSPLYRLGKFFKRNSPIKKLANATMSLTDFRVLKSDVARDAIDLLAVCTND